MSSRRLPFSIFTTPARSKRFVKKAKRKKGKKVENFEPRDRAYFENIWPSSHPDGRGTAARAWPSSWRKCIRPRASACEPSC